jgi:nicotinamidase/pyrazinamidase
MPEALLIVDFQNDFAAPDGALSVPGGDRIAERLNELARDDRYDVVIATRDWHPPDHCSFAEQGGPWPVHCVQGTPGAELHPGLDRELLDAVVDKGQERDTDGYSAFVAPELPVLLRENGITSITVAGLTTDYCVLNTGRDALREGFPVTIDSSAVRAVDVTEGDGERALDELGRLGADVRDLANVER